MGSTKIKSVNTENEIMNPSNEGLFFRWVKSVNMIIALDNQNNRVPFFSCGCGNMEIHGNIAQAGILKPSFVARSSRNAPVMTTSYVGVGVYRISFSSTFATTEADFYGQIESRPFADATAQIRWIDKTTLEINSGDKNFTASDNKLSNFSVILKSFG